MLQVNISSDIDKAMSEVHSFWRNQIPFATSVALNDSIFDVRRRIVNSTYPAAFTVRNKAFPGKLWRVVPKATKKRLETVLSQTLDRGYLERHATGGQKKGRSGGRVAVPNKPEAMRSKNGRIRANLKPKRLADHKKVYVINKGQKKFIMKRGRKGQKSELLYVITPVAKIDKKFAFYEDATDTALRVFSGHWNTAMNRAIRTSRFYAG